MVPCCPKAACNHPREPYVCSVQREKDYFTVLIFLHALNVIFLFYIYSNLLKELYVEMIKLMFTKCHQTPLKSWRPPTVRFAVFVLCLQRQTNVQCIRALLLAKCIVFHRFPVNFHTLLHDFSCWSAHPSWCVVCLACRLKFTHSLYAAGNGRNKNTAQFGKELAWPLSSLCEEKSSFFLLPR